MSLKKNFVFKAGDTIENVWTFKNIGAMVIPAGTKFAMIAGDYELNAQGIQVQDDVRPGEFFKLRVSLRAPAKAKHYSAGYILIDDQGNYFGDKVVIDIIVEDECSESVILAELMENPDMSLSSSKIEN